MITPSKLPRIVVVDDHPAVLYQTAALLSDEFDVIETMEDGRDLLPFAASQPIDAIVLDITLPGLTGIELAARLRDAGCRAKIVFLTVHSDPDYAREAFDVGALGYVLKPRLASDLIPALRAALAGKRFISSSPELDEFSQLVCARESS